MRIKVAGSEMKLCWVLLLMTFAERLVTGLVDYTGHVVLRLQPRSRDDYRLIWSLSQRSYLDLEIWGEPVRNHTLDIRVGPRAYNYITKCLDYYHISWDVEISDIQRLIDEQSYPSGMSSSHGARSRRSIKVRKYKKRRKYRGKKRSPKRRYTRRRVLSKYRQRIRRAFDSGQTIVGKYVRYRQMRHWMKYVEQQYPDFVKVLEIGRTYENRGLELIKIGTNGDARNKSAIWIDGGVHAREWIAPATAIYIIDKLVKDYGRNETTTKLLDTFNWYILPVANPDGYEYSHTQDRLWRKTRSQSHVGGYQRCMGVDLNRNFGFQWKGHCDRNWMFLCSSSNPCQSTYAGEVPFSEPETRAIAQKIYAHKDQIKLYLSLHSYSQLWLTPWGYTNHPPKDKLDLMNIARKGMDALRRTHGTHYQAGSPANILYAAGGGSYDWVKGVAGVKYSYTIELRDKGRYGFLLPRQYIIPVGEEMWNAVKVVANELMNRL